ncbi:twin-arginine translocation signal domain-containing protein [Mesorhizobium sp. AR07]|uniref:twin-arginine translocation signal domain-containing protein n=1 Tax=Mesorhizobium sp. AR07 TaxID=2865838 RepID=UPI002160237E|nr:twin-arginine translocation signal domain-containing protein [Mesorhizobium sp. AR07]UVK43040.1 twin-arginine translocation signal domain-containing protein [Mesorhizobium sp. AR07]
MDRRSFLTALLGVAGAAAVAGAVRPIEAMAGIPNVGNGILDELDAPDTGPFGDEGNQAQLQPVSHRRGHRGYYRRRHHRRPVWRRVCRRYWRHGRVHTRCYRRRV